MIATPRPDGDRTPGQTAANLIFITALALTLVLSVVEAALFPNNQNTVRSTLITELLGILAPALILVAAQRDDWRTTFSLNPLPLRLAWRAALIGFLAQFAVLFFAGLNQWIFDIFGPFPALFNPPKEIIPAIGFFLLLSLIPAICEEMLNRGVVLAGYRRVGFIRSVIVVGILFGLFHLYPSRFGYTALLGMVLVYLVLLSRSIFASMIAHFCFNLTSGISYIGFLIAGQVPEQKPYEYVDTTQFLPQLAISLVAGTFAYLVLRSYTTQAALLCPGIVIGRFGLAKDIIEDAQWTQPTPPQGFEYGQPPLAQPMYSSLSASTSPTYVTAPPQPQWQPIDRQRPTRARWVTGSFAAVLIFWAIFGVAQEIAIRVLYSDPKNQKPPPTAPAPQPKSDAPQILSGD